MRRLIAFPCEGDGLIGTLDAGPSPTGLLIVSGGNEIRCGPQRAMAALATEIATRGHPVFRYDRRGVGDSEGENRSFLDADTDLHAALAAFRFAAPMLRSIVAFGNCDGASLLATEGDAAGIDAVVLGNPWTIEPRDDLPPRAAIRARYAERLRDPASWRRLLRGPVDVGKLARGIGKALAPEAPAPLADWVIAGIARWGGAATVVTTEGDATAVAFRAAAPHVPVVRVPGAGHGWTGTAERAALAEVLLARLADVP